MYVGTLHLWTSTDTGRTWSMQTTDPFQHEITAIGPAPSAAGTVYAGSSFGELYVSVNGGDTWTDVGADVSDRFVSDIAVSPTTRDVAYVSLSGFGTGHVFRTANRGQDWTDVSGDLPDTPVNSIGVDSRLTPDRLYAATDVGVFTSADGGSTWLRYGRGLPNAVAMDVLLQPQTGSIVAATYGRGAFVAPLIGPPPLVRADYRFNHTLASSVGSPPKLRGIGPAANSFVTDTVDGSSRTVLAFPKGNGLELRPTTDLVAPSAYSIVVLARLANVSGFRRVLDFTRGTGDRGLYVVQGNLTFWPRSRGSGSPIHAGEYAQLVLTRDVDGTVVGYVDGEEQFTFVDSRGDALLSKGSIRFFVDDQESPGENSAGRVARIRLFRGALTADLVRGLKRL
jgi:hypothetical protein